MKNLYPLTKIAPASSVDAFEWTRRCRIATFDGYQPPLYPDRNYDAERMVRIARDVEANVIRIAAMGKLALFNTDQWEVDEYIKSHDFLGEAIDLAHAEGMKMVAYVPGAHHLPLDLLKKWHPEWIQRTIPNIPSQQPDEAAEKYQYHSGTLCGRVCPIGPYNDFYKSMLNAVIINCDVDGWYTDGWKVHYFDDVCYCGACRARFLEEMGGDIFSIEFSPGGAFYQRLVDWYHCKVVQVIQEAHAMVWMHKRIPSMINHIGGILGYEKSAPWADDVDAMHDVMHFERKTDPYNRMVSASYISSLGQRAWFYAGTYSHLILASPDTDGDDYAEKNYADERIYPFRKELYNECLIPLACGQGVNSYRCNSLFYDIDSPGKRIMNEIFGMAKNHPEVFEGAEYYCFVGILNQEEASDYYEGPWLKALVRQGIQATIFKREDIANLSFLQKFAVVATDGLELDAQKKMLEYVRCGGRWITSDDVFDLAKPGAVLLECPDGTKGFMCGRGVVVQVHLDIASEDLLETVEFATGNYLPYRVTVPYGELIPILATKHGLWALHLVNISKHLTGFHECGLEDIPPIENACITIWLPEGAMPKSVRLLRSAPEIDILHAETGASGTGAGGAIKICLPRLDEYETIVINMSC